MVKTNLQKSLESLTDERLQQEYEGAKNTGLESTYEAEIARRKGVTPEVTTPETVSMTPGLNELIEGLGEENIPDDVLDIIDPLRNPTEKYGLWGIRTKFGELDPEKQGKKLSDKWHDLYNTYGMEPDDPNIREIMRYLTRMRGVAESGKQISSSQYLMNQQKNLNPWMNMPGVQVASMGNLTGMGIPNALQQQQQQAELMQAGNLALNQTPAQVQAQVAAAQATQQGNYQAPTMTQQQMIQEAQQTGGTVNPFEATQAVYTPPTPTPTVHSGEASWQPTPSVVSKPPPRDYRAHTKAGAYGLQEGGVVSLMDLLNRRI